MPFEVLRTPQVSAALAKMSARAVEIAVSVNLALDPLLTLHDSLIGLPGDARLLRPAATDPLTESFDRAAVHPLLAKILA